MFKFLSKRLGIVKQALSKTRQTLSLKLRALTGKPWDDATFDALEEILYEADLGSACIEDLMQQLRKDLRFKGVQDFDTLISLLKENILTLLATSTTTERLHSAPHVILIVGVNGSVKTTSIAKLSTYYSTQGKKVLVAAADTFRAAAADQLQLWAEKIGVDIISSKHGADPSGVVFDALSAAKARGKDIVIIDTAGRLQNKTDLMQELEKIRRICDKSIPTTPHETLLVIDATTGQNGIDQALTFHKFTPLTGIILTKLDGTAKGGVILSIHKKLNIPVRWIGTGEGQDDFIPFNKEEYVDGLLGS
jgi:fused signal recognition particle receptor